MSKSVGNVSLPRDLLRRWSGPVLRWALLAAHYRSPLEFSNEAIADAAATYDRLATFAVNAARALPPGPSEQDVAAAEPEPFTERFVAAMDDDLNVPAAMAVLFDLIAESNPLIGMAERSDATAAAALRARLTTFNQLAARLGFFPLAELPPAAITPGLLDLLLELRQRARDARDFAASDLIRTRLGELGIRVEDRAGGSRWHLAR
jgi:cysteinyl-tRNA synthetase